MRKKKQIFGRGWGEAGSATRRGEEVSFHFNMRPSQRSRSVSEGLSKKCPARLSKFCKYTHPLYGNGGAEFPAAFAVFADRKRPVYCAMKRLEKMGDRLGEMVFCWKSVGWITIAAAFRVYCSIVCASLLLQKIICVYIDD